MPTIHKIFPTPIYTETIPVTDEVLMFAKQARYERMNSKNGSYTVDKYVLNDEKLKPLKTNILKALNNYVYENLNVSKKYNFELQNSWINEHIKGDWAQIHDHTNCLISGVYFIKIPENSGDLLIHKTNTTLFTRTIELSYDIENEFNNDNITFKPKEGGLILFPSHLYHSVTISNTNELRYTMAFNFFPKGKFGDLERQLELK